MPTTRFTNLVAMFEHAVASFGPQKLFGTKRSGRFEWTTYAEFGALVDACRGGLAARGVGRGDRVCLVSNNRVEWAAVAYACLGLGAVIVPMYDAQLPKEWAYIAENCGASAVVAGTDETYREWGLLRGQLPTLRRIIGLSLPPSDPESYAALIEEGRARSAPVVGVRADEPACFIYTSGTTANPKGVVLSHANILSNVVAVPQLFVVGPGDVSLSFLPWAHSFGHTCELHTLLALGVSIAICEGVDKILPNLAEVAPTVLLAVPRIFNKIYDGVNRQMADRPLPIRRLFRAGIDAAKKRQSGQPLSLIDRAMLEVADRLIFTKIRARFGGRLRFVICGGSALSREVAQFIDCLGIEFYEGYGLTEASPLVAVNSNAARRLGSVGKPIPGVRVEIDRSVAVDDRGGEILVYGDNVMVGYYQNDGETHAAKTADGAVRTGDLGYLDSDGYLFITGRIKEQYKLENGKYVAPGPLEEQIKLSPLISNVFVYGDNRPYNVALVVPNFEALRTWAARHSIPVDSNERLCADERVFAALKAEVETTSMTFKGYERIRRIALTSEEFTTANSMLTQSLKLRRRVVWQKYGPQIERLYTQEVADGKGAPAAA